MTVTAVIRPFGKPGKVHCNQVFAYFVNETIISESGVICFT